MESWVEASLVCPLDRSRVERECEAYQCAHGHRYPLVDGIPVMLASFDTDAKPWVDAFASMAAPTDGTRRGEVDPFVQDAILATNGNLYRELVGKLTRYPIPALPLADGEGQRFLDVGCNWGRWSVAAGRKGYRVVGIDPSISAIQAATRVARQLGVDASFVVAEATRLPFNNGTFDVVFSYGVLQHLDKPVAASALKEVARVFRDDGKAVVQLANAFGVRSLQNRARRAFRTRSPFESSYYTPGELRRLFGGVIGPTKLTVDGYFSLNAQYADLDLLPRKYRWIVRCSTALRNASKYFRAMHYLADSLYVTSTRGTGSADNRRS